MTRSLTAILAGPLLAVTVLSACGSPGTPAGGSPGSGPPDPALLNVVTETLPVTGALSGSGALRVTGHPPGEVSVSTSGPPGVTLTTALTAAGSDTLVDVTASGDRGGVITVTVQVGALRSSVPLPLLQAHSRAVPGGADQVAAAAPWQGGVLLRAPANASAEARHRLLAFTPATPDGTELTFPLSGLDTITGHAAAPDGSVWVAVRRATAEGSELIRRALDGTLIRVPAGTTETLSSLGVTPDGRVWAVVYGQARLLSAAADGTPGELVLGSVPDTLTVGSDGALFLTRRGDAPAVLRVDPLSGATQTFAVGTPGVSVPASPAAAPGGALVFTELRTGAAWRLDPRVGTPSALPVPTGGRASALAAAPDGSVWAVDPTAGTLLRFAGGHAARVSLGGAARALTVAPDGRVWFELSGQLITLE